MYHENIKPGEMFLQPITFRMPEPEPEPASEPQHMHLDFITFYDAAVYFIRFALFFMLVGHK